VVLKIQLQTYVNFGNGTSPPQKKLIAVKKIVSIFVTIPNN